MKTTKTKLVIWGLLLACSAPAVRSQVLTDDPRFSVLHGVRWGMSMNEIRNVYEKSQNPVGVTDSSLTLNSEFFGVPALTEIRFRQTTKGPSFIRIRFNEASNPLVDTIRRHFTQFAGKAPATTATEKKLFAITLRIEIAKWKIDQESVVLTTAYRDGVIGDVGLLISAEAGEKRKTP